MAVRPARRNTARGSARDRSRRQRTPARRTKQPLFHGGSFFTGMLVGIGATVVGAFLPGWWEANALKPNAVATAPDPEPAAETRFEFWDALPRDRVRTDNATRNTPGKPHPDTEFLVQAGSFEAPADADRMRAALLLLGLDVNTRAVTLDSGATWHRVLVGPFDSERDTRRAISRLREQNIEPLLLKRVKQG